MKEDKTIMEIRNDGFFREYCVCGYIRKDHFDIIKLIAAEMDRRFPARKAKYLEVVAAAKGKALKDAIKECQSCK